MTNCSKISKNLTLVACANSVAGLRSRLVLIKFDDIDRKQTKPMGNILEGIILKDNAVAGLEWEFVENGLEADCTLNKGTYRNTFSHKVAGKALLKSQEVKDEIGNLAHSRVVAVVENKDNNSEETRFEVYGFENGLRMAELSSPTTDADGVHYSFSLQSDDNARESALPLSFYAGDADSTEAAFAALIKK